MTEVVSVQFRGRGKTYYFDPAGVKAAPGDLLVLETSKGLELGECVRGNHAVDDAAVVQPLRAVARAATDDDRRVAEINRKREKEAFGIAEEKIAKHGLEMKLVDVECSFEGNKILFFFTADGRVDFRELVKDLASVFRTRIELRQIGVRDEAKMLGGLGICGQPFCCSRFLTDFQPVSTKMAKIQSMSLNPAKISGSCGRLMCCLRYEQEAYEDLVKHVPKTGTFVQTADGYGNVVLVNLLRQSVKVRMDGAGDPVFHTYPVDDIAEVPGGRPPEGEPLPKVLQPKPKRAPEPEPAEDKWVMPALFADSTPAAAAEASAEGAPSAPETAPVPPERPEGERSGSSRRRNRGRGRSDGAPRPAPEDRTDKSRPVIKVERLPGPPGRNPPRKQTPGKPPLRAEGAPAADAAGTAAKKRRRRHNRPRPKDEGGSAPE